MGGPHAGLPILLERVSNAFMLDWLSVKEGVELVPIGDAVAALSPSEPELDFVNRIYGNPPPARRGARAVPRGRAAALRRRGAQTALIRCRIRDAAAAGCTLVSTGTSDAISRCNLERAGLCAAYVQSAWRGPE